MKLVAALAIAAGLLIPATASANVNDPNADPVNRPTLWLNNSFQSPTGNIKCHYWPAPDNEVTCTTLNTGLTVYLTRWLHAGSRYAHLSEGHGPTLFYGQRWVVSGFRCDSAFSGMTCRSSSGHGFSVNRTNYNLW